jgi:superfamily II DNA or RNA helicase
MALHAWEHGDSGGAHRGTLEIVTGGGKTLIALEAFARATVHDDRYRLAIVVPTEALARQWRDSVVDLTTIQSNEIGIMGAGERGSLQTTRVLIGVLNSAAKYLPADAAGRTAPLMLVVDECHRAGAPSFSSVLATKADRRLGLSATPDRQDVDDDGLPIDYDAHLLGRSLGGVVYRFGLKDAAAAGWLPPFVLQHHAVELGGSEHQKYVELTRRIDDLAQAMSAEGVAPWEARRVAAGTGKAAPAARAYVAAVASRKDVLYRSRERGRIAALLVERAMRDGAARVILFHERVAEVEGLAGTLRARLGTDRVAIEHSSLPQTERRRAIAGFRTGEIPVLVSVRSLIEGINVPEADVGISVASSSSVRQRVQSLGRVLRRGIGTKAAQMHMLYVADTTDDAIYGKEDWSDLTGRESNRYWRWALSSAEPTVLPGPPRTPLALEDVEWERHGRTASNPPREWLGVMPEGEYSVDTQGNVTTPSGASVANPQDVGAMLKTAERHGGRFRVTPLHRIVLVSRRIDDATAFVVVGRLPEPFEVRAWAADEMSESERTQIPGEPYAGPLDKERGAFLLKRTNGGVVARRRKDGMDFAVTDPAVAGIRADNARRVLAAWKELGDPGRPFYLNSRSMAWIETDGQAIFLADVPGGFFFAGDEIEETTPDVN